MKKIVYLPLDERPCNYNFPQLLAEGKKDFKLVAPDIGLLGKKKKPADFNGISNFLKTECKDAEYLILSVEMLLYGGLLPSRLHNLTEECLQGRLNFLVELKKTNPKLKIYAFALIMRCPSYSSADEEPDYYGICGREIFLYGQAEHKYRDGVISCEEFHSQVETLMPIIGDALDDYLKRRRINLSLLKRVLTQVGVCIDKFVIPQDDSAPHGYTAMDREAIKAYIAEKGFVNTDIYPGADELGMTMLSAVVNDIYKFSPKIYPVYPDDACKKLVPRYEDRAVELSVKSQIESAGCKLAYSKDDADILLYLNLPLSDMVEADEPETAGDSYKKRDLFNFTSKMIADFKNKRRIAVADVGYSNGGDVEWAKMIEESVGIESLFGYAGWNTCSITLGTVICEAVLSYYYNIDDTHKRFIAMRVFEDVAYMAKVRRAIRDNILIELGITDDKDLNGKEGIVSNIVKEQIEFFMNKNFPKIYKKYQITEVTMPWNRMFEIYLSVRKTSLSR